MWSFHLDAVGADAPAERGLAVGAIEAATAWVTGDVEACRREADWLVELAVATRARVVAAACLEETLGDEAARRAALGILVEAAASGGVAVALEFLPWTGVPDLATAWSLVEPLDRQAGLLLDTWHWQRQPGGPVPELLAQIPGERIAYVQVCDAAAGGVGSFDEAMAGRLLPGQGVVDFAAVFEGLRTIESRPFVAAEIFNAELMGQDPSVAAKVMAEACRSILD